MTTYNGTNLDELGVVGKPVIEYADFQSATYTANGMDGSVLSNFKRGATTIKFDLTITGTEAQRLEKMTTLANCLNTPTAVLVLPGQESSYFEASPNVTITPNRYMDGFTIPLSFVVPRGHALGQEKTVTCSSLTPTQFEVGGIAPAIWSADIDTSGTYYTTIYVADNEQMNYANELTIPGTNVSAVLYLPSPVFIDADTRTTIGSPDVAPEYGAPTSGSTWPELTPGTWYIYALDEANQPKEITLKYREALLW